MVSDYERGFVFGQLAAYTEQVLTGTKMIAQLGCRNELLDEVREQIEQEGLIPFTDDWAEGRSTVWICRDSRAAELIGEINNHGKADPLAMWAMGKAFGYSDRDVLEYCYEHWSDHKLPQPDTRKGE